MLRLADDNIRGTTNRDSLFRRSLFHQRFLSTFVRRIFLAIGRIAFMVAITTHCCCGCCSRCIQIDSSGRHSSSFTTTPRYSRILNQSFTKLLVNPIENKNERNEGRLTSDDLLYVDFRDTSVDYFWVVVVVVFIVFELDSY